MITECCVYCIYRFDCEDYNEEDAEVSICYGYTAKEEEVINNGKAET